MVEPPFGLRIFEATDEDSGYVESCIRRSIERSVSDIERQMSALWIDTILEISGSSIRERRMDDEVFVLRDINGEHAGSLWLGRSVDQFTCDGTGYLLGIFVEPDLRGRGIGSYLLDFAERWCLDKGFLSLSLNVGWHNDSARHFYDRHGYGIRSEVRKKELCPRL